MRMCIRPTCTHKQYPMSGMIHPMSITIEVVYVYATAKENVFISRRLGVSAADLSTHCCHILSLDDTHSHPPPCIWVVNRMKGGGLSCPFLCFHSQWTRLGCWQAGQATQKRCWDLCRKAYQCSQSQHIMLCCMHTMKLYKPHTCTGGERGSHLYHYSQLIWQTFAHLAMQGNAGGRQHDLEGRMLILRWSMIGWFSRPYSLHNYSKICKKVYTYTI